ncbi:hypothetical protein K788_0008173 [Paraburkholderia caribensis MBA4]|uniref:Uncharacterized protein n=1 Tax=Paraburkholderia caribensis MBA4 TaxID=1323664 RepID=A0A0P0R8E7_9BURK|nr:hypothetical protein K788_0008173 [Paraburkholderia caribensis MBA4]
MVFDEWLLFQADILTRVASKDFRAFARRAGRSRAIRLLEARAPSYDPRFDRQMRR